MSFNGGYNAGDGGMLDVAGDVVLHISDSTTSFTECYSEGDGGAVSVSGTGSFAAVAVSGDEYVHFYDNRADGSGGAINYASSSTFDASGMEIYNNVAGVSGGGLNMAGASSMSSVGTTDPEIIYGNLLADYTDSEANIACGTGTCNSCDSCAGPYGRCLVPQDGSSGCSCTAHPDGAATAACGCPAGTSLNTTSMTCIDDCPVGSWNDGRFTSSCLSCSGAAGFTDCALGALVAETLDASIAAATADALADLESRVGAQTNDTLAYIEDSEFEVVSTFGILELDIADALENLPEFDEDDSEATARLSTSTVTSVTAGGLSQSTLTALGWVGAAGIISGLAALRSLAKSL